ncbi:MAG: hypothetical protein RR824_06420 [Clostridia bacterium]
MNRFLHKALCLSLALFMALSLTPMGASAAQAEEKINKNLYVRTDYNNPEQVNTQALTVVGNAVYLFVSNLDKLALERWTPGMDKPEHLQSYAPPAPKAEDVPPDVAAAEAVATEAEAATTEAATEAAATEAPATDAAAPAAPAENALPQLGYVNMLFNDGKSVYAYYNGDVYRLTDEQGTPSFSKLYTLDVSAMRVEQDGYVDEGSMLNMFVMDGKLFMLNESYANEVTHILAQYDFATGKLLKTEKQEKLYAVSPYKDGLLLGFWQESANPYDEETQMMIPNDLITYDPQTGATVTLAQAHAYGDINLAYNPATNSAYFVSGSTVYSLPNMQGEIKLSAYLPLQSFMGNSQNYGIMDCGSFVTGNYDGVFIRALDMPNLSQGALTIAGDYNSTAHNSVISAHPEMTVAISDGYYDKMETLTAAMLSGTDALDLIKLNSAYAPLQRLIEKGYATDLSAFPDLMGVAGAMDPRFTDGLKKDGKLYGLPVAFDGSILGYNSHVWTETFGLTEADLPATFVELLDFFANYYADYGEDHPEISIMDNLDMSNQLMGMLMDYYCAYQMKNEGIVRFDTPLFRKLMKALEAIDFKEIDPFAVSGQDIYNDQEATNEFWSKPCLFTRYVSVNSPDMYKKPIADAERSIVPLVLALDEGMEPILPVTLDVFIINPKTNRMDQAGMYLSEYAKHYDVASANITLFPEHNEAVPNNYYEINLKQNKERIEELNKQLKTADEENKASMRDELKYLENYIANSEADRMRITEEMIAEYRQKISPYLFVMQQTPLTDYGSSGSELQTQLNQYKEGAIDLETFIREIDKRVKMMMLEDQ